MVENEVAGYKNHNHLIHHIDKWFEHCPRRSEDGPRPKVLQDFEDAFTKEELKDSKLLSTLRLERELLKQAPKGMRDNQPSISDILNLPF